MTISTSKLVKVNYTANIPSFSSVNTNVLLFIDDVEKTKGKTPIVKKISSESPLSEIVDATENPTAFKFNSTVVNDYYYVAVHGDETPAILTSGDIGDFQTFSDAFDKNGLIELKVKEESVKIALTHELKTEVYPSFESLVTFLNISLKSKATATLSTDNTQIQIASEDTGDDAKLSWLTVPTGTVASMPIFVSAAISSDEFNTIKTTYGAKEAIALVFKNSDNSDIFTLNFDARVFASYTDISSMVADINTKDPAKLYCYLSTDNGRSERLVFVFLGLSGADLKDLAVPTSAEDGFVASLKLDDDTGGKRYKGAMVPNDEGADLPALLKMKEGTAGATKTDGRTGRLGTADLMLSVKTLLSSSSSPIEARAPNAFVISRNLCSQNNADSPDNSFLVNYALGFNTYFKEGNQPPLSALFLQTSTAPQSTGEQDPFQSIKGSEWARCVVLNYHSKDDEYLDGAVASYATSINFANRTNSYRYFQGLEFGGVTADTEISTDYSSTLDFFGFNYYSNFTNGAIMYCNGVTAMPGFYIDNLLSVNVIILDSLSKLLSILKTGRLTLDMDGSLWIKNVLTILLDKYKRSGCLGTTEVEDVDELGDIITKTRQAYEIEVPTSFSTEDFVSRDFPTTTIYLGLKTFAKTISCELSSYFTN